MKNNSVLQNENLQKIQKLFATEEEYRMKIQTLRKTRNALHHIWETTPHFKEEILDQAKVLNDLISALLVEDLPHPWLEDSGLSEITINDSVIMLP